MRETGPLAWRGGAKEQTGRLRIPSKPPLKTSSLETDTGAQVLRLVAVDR